MISASRVFYIPMMQWSKRNNFEKLLVVCWGTWYRILSMKIHDLCLYWWLNALLFQSLLAKLLPHVSHVAALPVMFDRGKTESPEFIKKITINSHNSKKKNHYNNWHDLILSCRLQNWEQKRAKKLALFRVINKTIAFTCGMDVKCEYRWKLTNRFFLQYHHFDKWSCCTSH